MEGESLDQVLQSPSALYIAFGLAAALFVLGEYRLHYSVLFSW